MFKKIVLTTDLSENAQAAAPLAMELAGRYGGTVYLLHILEELPLYAVGEGIVAETAEWYSTIYRSREERLQSAAVALGLGFGPAVKLLPVMRQGSVVSEIVKFAGEEHADCIVISTHGRTGLSRTFFGSVAERVLRLSACPVFSVRPPGAQTQAKAGAGFKTIVLPTDLSANADAAVPYAAELSRRFGATIHLIHVCEEEQDLYYATAAGGYGVSAPIDRWLKEDHIGREKRLNEMARSLGALDQVRVVHLLQRGHAAERIALYAEVEKAGLIVMATHGRTGLSHLLVGSVAEKVARTARCPVLSVKPPEMYTQLAQSSAPSAVRNARAVAAYSGPD